MKDELGGTQSEVKSAAFAFFAFCPKDAVVSLHDVTGDGQTQAGASLTPSTGAI